MNDFDLFLFFTQLIFLALTVYYALSFVSLGRQIRRLLAGDDPARRMLRLYVSYHLVTVDFRPLRSELLQIVAWLVALIAVTWLNLRT